MNLNDKTSSFSVLTINPKISGNVKITTDSTGNIWLNSIDSTKELSTSQFKKFRIGTGTSFEADLKNFFNGLPPEIVFSVKENKPNPENTSNSFKDQYDFFYNMGAQSLISNFYDEEYSYTAPLWLRNELPKYFVIFRVDEPLDFPYNTNIESGDLISGSRYVVKGDDFRVTYNQVAYTTGQIIEATANTEYTSFGTGKVILLDENKDLPINTSEQFNSLVKRAQIIKTFDLTENSNIGKYIRNIVNNKFFPSSPINVRFDDGLMSTWNGVSYKEGIITSKGERLNDYWSNAQLQIDFEEYITSGFERHGIICPYLLNLEFLFNDETTDLYSIPRYFGFYVNDIPTATVQLDGDLLFENKAVSGNIPAPKRANKGFSYSNESFFQTNEDGVRLFYKNEEAVDSATSFVPNSESFNDENFKPRFFWLQDKNKNFYSFDQKNDGTNEYNTTQNDIVIRDKSIDLGLLSGPGSVRLQSKGSLLSEKGRSYMILKVKETLYPNDKLYLYWNLGLLTDSNGKYHVITANDLTKRPFTISAGGTLLTVSGMDLTGQYEINQRIEINYANGRSITREIVTTPTYSAGDMIFNIDSAIDLTTTSGTLPIVEGWGPGSAMISADNTRIYFHPYGTNAQIATAIASALNLIEVKTFDAVAIEDEIVLRMKTGGTGANSFFMMGEFTSSEAVLFQTNSFSASEKYYFEGGTNSASIRLKFPYVDSDILKETDLYIKTKRGLSKISFVGRYVDEAVNATGSSEVGSLTGYNEFGSLYIEDNLDEPTITNTGYFIVYSLYKIPVGLFSVFNIKEMDGDFFSSTYSRSPIIEYHRYFDILADTDNVLVPGRKYLVKAAANVSPVIDSISYAGETIYATEAGTEFIAGVLTDEVIGEGNGASKSFASLMITYTPLEKGSVSITDTVETFVDDENGVLLGSLGGTGTVDYETGEVNLNFLNVVSNAQNITCDYNTLAGFSVISGTPFVVAEIFYSSVANSISADTSLVIGRTYLVLGDPSIPIMYDNSTIIYASREGTSFSPTTIDPYIILTSSVIVLDVTNFKLDDDLKSFPGFWKFKDFVSIENSTIDTNIIDFTNREKFVHHDINVEYDYLKENFSKNESIKSRVVPIISKWVYSGGSDVRDNPYRLNTHPVFGNMNFSPSPLIKTQDPNGFSHEWPYLEQPPHQYPSAFLKDNYYFFNDRIDLDLIKDADPSLRDTFTDYFTFFPCDNTEGQERYSMIKYNQEIGLCETFFRGVKIRIKEVIQDTKIKEIKSLKPPFKDRSTTYNNYKFSVLLRPIKEDPTIVQSPVTFNLIENATTKSILFLIDFVVQDYRTLSLENPLTLGQYTSPVVTYPDSLDNSIDYLLLYSMKSKKTEVTINDTSNYQVEGLDIHDFGDIKLSVSLNPSPPSGLIGNYTVISVIDNPDYDWDLRDEIKNFEKENTFEGEFIFGDVSFPYPLSVSQKQIYFGLTGNVYPQSYPQSYAEFLAPVPTPVYIPFGSSYDWEGFPVTQLKAGNLYYEPIIQKLSFGRIYEKINEYSPYIKYNTYYWDDNTLSTKITPNKFYIEFDAPSKITKTEAIVPQVDADKPEEFKTETVIGVDFIKVKYFNEIYRYSGPYEPKFKNILFFENQKTDVIEEADLDLSFKQATLDPLVENFGTIKNLGYIKVSNNDVLSLANNPKYKPRYPLLNEIPTDYRDFFIFQSNWDPGFWRIYNTKKNFFSQAGTREMLEVKNFMGTKIMKTQTSLRIQDFIIEPKLDTLNQVNIENYDGEIIYSIENNKLSAQINIKKRLLRFFVEDGANSEFTKYLISEFGTGDPASLDDDVVEYLTLNVLPTYEVKLLDTYIKKYKENLGLDIIRGDLSDSAKLSNGYLLDKNFSVQKKSDFVYSFEYSIDNSTNISISPSLTLGKI